MKRLFRKFSAVLLLLVSSLTLVFGAVPAFAETDDATKAACEQATMNFLSQVYTLDEDQLKQLESNGGFYEVFYQDWESNRDIVGDFEAVESVSAEDKERSNTDANSTDQVVVTAMVKFSKYEAEVQLYFNDEGQTPANYVMNVQYSISEKLAQAGENMAVGLITVFAVLAILIIIMMIEGKIFTSVTGKKNSKKAQSDAEEAEIPVRSNASAVRKAPAAAASGTASDTEIAAVIAAAIAAAMEDEPVTGGYVVRSVRKLGSGKWKRV